MRKAPRKAMVVKNSNWNTYQHSRATATPAPRTATTTATTTATKTKNRHPTFEKWIQTSYALHHDAKLATREMLLGALVDRAPLAAVQCIVSCNPKAAMIPPHGPTPLQVAVQFHDDLKVIRCVLTAWPFALCMTNPDRPMDPLTYVRKYRKNDAKLIRLLSHPLSHWVGRSLGNDNGNGNGNSDAQQHRTQDASSLPKPNRRRQVRQLLPPERRQQHNGTNHNVANHSGKKNDADTKHLQQFCKYLYGQQKKLHREVHHLQRDMQALQDQKSNMLEALKMEQKRQFYLQRVALDMKEKAMVAHLDRVEAQILRSWQSQQTEESKAHSDESQAQVFVVEDAPQPNPGNRNITKQRRKKQPAGRNTILPNFCRVSLFDYYSDD